MLKNKKRVTLLDVAKLAKVSRSSVCQVLLSTGGKNVVVGKETAERIRKAAKELNYQPNTIARQLKGMKSNVIGVVIDSCAPEIDFSRLSEMERQAARRGYKFMIGQSHGEIERLEEYAADFSSRGVDGVICISHRYPGKSKRVESVFSRFSNLVFIGKSETNSNDNSFVSIDLADGICQACDYLRQQSRKNIGMLLLSSGSSAMEERLTGYCRALQLNKANINKELIQYIGEPDELSIDHIKPSLQRMIDNGQANAILATNDKVALVTMRCLESMGMRVPHDVAVIGCDNLDFAEFSKPALTTIDQCITELSHTTVNILVDLIEGKKLPVEDRQKVIKPKLVVRESA